MTTTSISQDEMTIDSAQRLTVPEPPSIYAIRGRSEDIYRFGNRLDYNTLLSVRHIRGRKAETLSRFFDESSSALQFPWYFGENWNAWKECFGDLSWLRAEGILVVIYDAAVMFRADDQQLERSTLIRIIEKVTTERTAHHPGVPFHVLLHQDPEDRGMDDWISQFAALEI